MVNSPRRDFRDVRSWLDQAVKVCTRAISGHWCCVSFDAITDSIPRRHLTSSRENCAEVFRGKTPKNCTHACGRELACWRLDVTRPKWFWTTPSPALAIHHFD